MGFRRHFVFIPRRISISHLTIFPTFTYKNPGDDTAHARLQRASDAYECLNRPDGCDLHESYQYSDDEDGDFGEAFVFFSMGGGGFGFAPGSRAGGAAEFFRHFWSADFDDDHFDEQQRSWEEVEQKRAERERRRQKDEREAKKARQRRRDLEAAAAERKRWEKGCEKREQAAHAAAATASKAEALRENKNTQRVAAANDPPPPSVVHRDSNEITLHLTRGKHVGDGKVYPASAQLEVEWKRKRDGPFSKVPAYGAEQRDTTSTRVVFTRQTTVTIAGLAPQVKYRFRTRLVGGAFGEESVYATTKETFVETDAVVETETAAAEPVTTANATPGSHSSTHVWGYPSSSGKKVSPTRKPSSKAKQSTAPPSTPPRVVPKASVAKKAKKRTRERANEEERRRALALERDREHVEIFAAVAKWEREEEEHAKAQAA